MLNIILVDDNLGDQKLFQDTLRDTGIEYRLRTASSGAQGLKLVKEEKPDLLILDVMMPGISGYEVCNILKFDPAHKFDTPIVLLTGRKEEIDPRFGTLMKVHYMQKPCNEEELGLMIRTLCQGKV